MSKVATVKLMNSTHVSLDHEVLRARKKFPGNRFLLAALTEEVGELAQALLQGAKWSDVRREAKQVATVALRIYEEGDSTFDDITPEESKS